MTNDMMNVRLLVEKSADADLLREMIGFGAKRLIELEVGGATGAGFGEKSPMCLAQRNCCRDRDWEKRAGTTELRIPVAQGQLLPTLSRAASNRREGSDGRHSGSLSSRHLDALG
ncbi:transposase [Rhizobium sophoriradicis]|uniref:transposase n=1 Tax=Rhizobium sophoriradicis TaxID=1535245 RepID=UPI003CC9F8A8